VVATEARPRGSCGEGEPRPSPIHFSVDSTRPRRAGGRLWRRRNRTDVFRDANYVHVLEYHCYRDVADDLDDHDEPAT
jgi:hypothetical protein